MVPLSTTPPAIVEDYHCRITLANPLPAPFDNPQMWAKCDMISTVSIDRLDRFKEARNRHTGARKWRTEFLDPGQVTAVRAALAKALGFT